MIEVYAKANSMGVADAAIDHWLDRVDSATGEAPRNMIAAGRAHEVIEMLDAMGEGVFA